MRLTEIESWPPDSNPFKMDAYHMGTPFGKGWMILHPHHASEEFKYAIMVHIPSGRRWKMEPAMPDNDDQKPATADDDDQIFCYEDGDEWLGPMRQFPEDYDE